MNRSDRVDDYAPIPRGVVIRLALSHLNERVVHVCNITLARQAHPHLDIRNEVECWIIEAPGFVRAAAHQCQRTNRATETAKHEFEPFCTLRQLRPITLMCLHVGALLSNRFDSAVDEERTGMTIKRLNHSSQ